MYQNIILFLLFFIAVLAIVILIETWYVFHLAKLVPIKPASIPQSINISINGKVLTKGEIMNLSVDKAINVAIVSEADQFGNAETLTPDAPPAWSMADASMGTLVAAADGMSAIITPSGKLGDLTVSVAASFGGKAVNGSATGTMVAGAVASIALSLAQ